MFKVGDIVTWRKNLQFSRDFGKVIGVLKNYVFVDWNKPPFRDLVHSSDLELASLPTAEDYM